MMQRGCLGFLLKDTTEENLVAAIEQVYTGLEFIEPTLKEYITQNMDSVLCRLCNGESTNTTYVCHVYKRSVTIAF